MRVTIESDREVTIDGVGLLQPNVPAVVSEEEFANKHGIRPAEANFPYFVTVTYDTTEEGGRVQ